MHFTSCTVTAILLAIAHASSIKRGLCHILAKHHDEDDQVWISQPNSELTWYYNYQYEPSEAFKNTPNLQFVPMLWGAPQEGDEGTPFLDSVLRQIEEGADIKYALSFNEPDHPFHYGGSNIRPRAAVEEWIRQVKPLKDHGVMVGAPAVSGSREGYEWLQSWFDFCGNDCSPDFLSFHWQGDFDTMASVIGSISVAWPHLPLWVTEYSYPNANLQDTQWFFNSSMAMFESWRYADSFPALLSRIST